MPLLLYIFQVRRIHRFTASLGEKTNERREIEARLASMISIIVTIFAVCNSFEAIVFILSIQKKVNLDVVQNYLRPISDLLMVVNSSVNVIIYVVFKKDFKEKLYALYSQVNSKNSSKQKPLPGPTNISMIPMMRAQLPKTSVELTSAASREQQGNVSVHHSIPNDKQLGESTPLLEDEQDVIAKPTPSDSDTGYDSSFKENSSVVKDGTSFKTENAPESNQNLETDYAEENDQETVFAHYPIPNDKQLGESTPLYEHEQDIITKPMPSESDKGCDNSSNENTTIAKDVTSSTNEHEPESNKNLEKECNTVIVNSDEEPTETKKEPVRGNENNETKHGQEVLVPTSEAAFIASRIVSEVLQAVDEEMSKVEAVKTDTFDREFVNNSKEERTVLHEELPNGDKGIDKTK